MGVPTPRKSPAASFAAFLAAPAAVLAAVLVAVVAAGAVPARAEGGLFSDPAGWAALERLTFGIVVNRMAGLPLSDLHEAVADYCDANGIPLDGLNPVGRLAARLERAEPGDADSARLLRLLAENGLGAGDAEPLRWLARAADLGDADAMYGLAMARLEGRGGVRDEAEAAGLLRRAADLGHEGAAEELARIARPAP